LAESERVNRLKSGPDSVRHGVHWEGAGSVMVKEITVGPADCGGTAPTARTTARFEACPLRAANCEPPRRRSIHNA